jgi:hypothetical protein
MSKLLNAKLIMTVLLGVVYFGALIWALRQGKLEINSFIAGVGPFFGMAWAFWFQQSETPKP